MSAYAKFFIKLGTNERIEAFLELKPDERSAIHGTVTDGGGLPVADAVVMLFETGRTPEDLTHLTQMFTDESGRFAFGPLTPGRLYMLKVFKNSVKLRELEVVADAPA